MAKQKQSPAQFENPRVFADKSDKQHLKKAINLSLELESDAVRRNTQTFNKGRYLVTGRMDDYQELKDLARKTKEHAIQNLPELIQTLRKAVEARGGHFYLARDARDASKHVKKIIKEKEGKLVVKAKSMTSEEIKLNHVLEAAGIEVVETDLGEMILQLSDEHPSHIVGPAIHRSRERISELFKANFDTDEPLETGEELTKFARDRLREKFLSADIGISGANMIAADSGTIVLVESEGNIRMVTQAPPVHIAVAGVEKIVPTREDLIPFLELLGPSGTGQPLTTYTNIISPPLDVPPFAFDGGEKKPREFYMVLIDNGRMAMRNDPQLREALYCIRCGACLNSCANFQSLGGHAFGGETYSGGIGGSWEAGTGELENANFNDLCTGCSRCVPQCPVRIDIPWLNIVLRDRLNKKNRDSYAFIYKGLMPDEPEDKTAPLQKQFFGNYFFFAKLGSHLAPVSNWLSDLTLSRLAMEKLVGLDRRRHLPAFASKTLQRLSREWQLQLDQDIRAGNVEKPSRGKALLFADVYTNHLSPEWGMSTLRVFNRVGIDMEISGTIPEGRASLSQGMIATSAKRAKQTAAMLEPYIDSGLDVIVIEPSVLALFRADYRHLISDTSLFRKLQEHTFEPLEYLEKLFAEQHLDLEEFFDIQRINDNQPALFYHSHCQQRSSDTAQPTINLLKVLGFDVKTSEVECCGMAGSFGFKQDYYDVSMRVGEQLFEQIKAADAEKPRELLLASGTSCHDQIYAGTGRDVIHPMELLAQYLKV